MFPFLCFSRVSFLQIAFLSHPFVIFASSLECVVFVALYNYISSHHSFFFFFLVKNPSSSSSPLYFLTLTFPPIIICGSRRAMPVHVAVMMMRMYT